MRLAHAAAVAVCLLALSGCNRGRDKAETPAAPEGKAPANAPLQAPIGFQHEPGFDGQGFYRPLAPIQAGNFQLAQVAVGAPSDFDAWESGKRDAAFGPIVLEFEDVTSPVEEDEMGQRHAVRVRVLPLAYRLTPGQISFHGKDDQIGEIDLEATIDTAALAQARSTGSSDGKAVLSGSLQAGKLKFTGVSMSYMTGD